MPKSTVVSEFLDEKNLPLRSEIEELRQIILNADEAIVENIKWNGPNYNFNQEDRITMRIHPPTQIQIIFHCGVKVKEQPLEKLIKEDFGILTWKTNDRAIATFKNRLDIEKNKTQLKSIVSDWLKNP